MKLGWVMSLQVNKQSSCICGLLHWQIIDYYLNCQYCHIGRCGQELSQHFCLFHFPDLVKDWSKAMPFLMSHSSDLLTHQTISTHLKMASLFSFRGRPEGPKKSLQIYEVSSHQSNLISRHLVPSFVLYCWNLSTIL